MKQQDRQQIIDNIDGEIQYNTERIRQLKAFRALVEDGGANLILADVLNARPSKPLPPQNKRLHSGNGKTTKSILKVLQKYGPLIWTALKTELVVENCDCRGAAGALKNLVKSGRVIASDSNWLLATYSLPGRQGVVDGNGVVLSPSETPTQS